MKLFVAALAAETNTFSPIPTSRQSFRDANLYAPGELPEQPFEFAAPVWVARQRVRQSGWELVEGTCAGALPAGLLVRSDYECLRDEILAQLREALPVDAVVLSMHGAMVAESCLDCEGDMLARVRDLVGPDVVVGLELDPHCHLTGRMTESADAIVIFKEYPHTDFVERAEELLDIVERTVQGDCRPVMSTYDCRMLGVFHTTREPMLGYLTRLRALEAQPGILSISIAHGFPWGDVPEGGTRILVVTDDNRVLGAEMARRLGEELYALRGTTSEPLDPWRETLDWALEQPGEPVVLADSSDNPGGGAPGDSTWVLRHLLDSGAERVCLGPLWDPVSVRFAFDAGVGARLALRVGGKVGPASGAPLDVDAEVTGLLADALQGFAGARTVLGDCAAIRVGGIDVVLSSVRNQALGVDLFTNLGIEPRERHLVVVKSSQHFHDAFAPFSACVRYLNTPGALSQDLHKVPYQRLRQDIWPFCEA